MNKVTYVGKIFEIVETTQPDGRVFEKAVRAPGVRLIISNKNDGTVLLTKEYRAELNGWDYRLPGGKVFDTLSEYYEFKSLEGNILHAASKKAEAEGVEEAGLIVKKLELFKKSTLGATVDWDLYVFEVIDWQKSEVGQQLEVGEQIHADEWFTYLDARIMILDGQMQEERVALILLQWLEKQEV